MSQLEEYIKGYERSLVRRGISNKTILAYNWAFKNLIKVIGDQNLSEQTLENWQDAMIVQHLSPKSRSLAITAIKQLILWGADREIFNYKLARVLEKVKTPDGKPHPLTRDDLFRIKAYLLLHENFDIIALRDKALFFYLLTTGARVSEALQVRRDNYESCMVLQKGRSEKILTVPVSVRGLIEGYLAKREDNSPWLWVSHQPKKPSYLLTPAGVRGAWRRMSKATKVPYWTTHSIRHTCATELLEAGVPELVIAEHLGHHGLKNLHVYGQVRDRQRQEALQVMNNLVVL